jgi:NADH dehydrogenase
VTPAGDRPRVVVVGAGFAGLWAARGLAGAPVDVTLVDRNNYHTFYPLLYQVAAAELGPTDIAYPVRAILRRAENVRFRMADATGLDLDGRQLLTSSGPIPWDWLVLAPGSVPAFFGVEGAREHAFPLRLMDDALPLRRTVLGRFKTASHEADRATRRRLLTFVIVGGGPTGVEYAGALAELVYGPLRKDYPTVDADEVRIVLVEGLDRLLSGMEPHLSEYARGRLGKRRVEVRLGTQVTRIRADAVELADGDVLPTETVVWTAGVQGDPMVRAWGLPVGKAGRVVVTSTLQVAGHAEVFVAGDLAFATDVDGSPLPQVAPVAIQQGEHVARAVRALVEGRPAPPFRYRDPGMLAVIGRNAAVAELFGRTFKGFPAWIFWVLIHIAKLIGFRNRALVLVNWAWNYVFFERAVRLVLPAEREGPAGR